MHNNLTAGYYEELTRPEVLLTFAAIPLLTWMFLAMLPKPSMSTLIKWYAKFLGIQLWFWKLRDSLHRYHLVYLDVDTKGPYIALGCRRVGLELYRAQALKGVRIGLDYYTNNLEEKLIEVELPDD